MDNASLLLSAADETVPVHQCIQLILPAAPVQLHKQDVLDKVTVKTYLLHPPPPAQQSYQQRSFDNA